VAFSELNPLFEPLGISISAMYRPKYRSYGIASATVLRRKVTSFGALGKVWVFPTAFLSDPQPQSAHTVVSPDSVTPQ